MGGVSQRAPTVASASHKRFLVRPRRHSASLLTTMRRHADPDGPPERSLGIPRSFLAREKNTSFGASCPDTHGHPHRVHPGYPDLIAALSAFLPLPFLARVPSYPTDLPIPSTPLADPPHAPFCTVKPPSCFVSLVHLSLVPEKPAGHL